MNSFQILDSEGKAIAINTLDAEAAAFWGKEYDTKTYANPSEPREEGESDANFYRRSMTTNWFDCIGWHIANQGNYTSGWQNVVHAMMAEIIGTHFISTTSQGQIPLVEFRQVKEIGEDGEQLPALHLPDNIERGVYGTLAYFKPYIELINHWVAKGYTPKQIKE